MAFGIGKDKDAPQTGAQPAQQPSTQMSPEAMAMLAQMAQGGAAAGGQPGAAQMQPGQAPAQPATPMAPTMPPQGMAPNMGMPGAGAPGLPQMPGMPQLPVSPAANPSLSKRNGARLSASRRRLPRHRARKKRNWPSAARRNQVTVFTRKIPSGVPRQCRAGLTLWTMLLLITIFGPILVNSMLLLPQTRQNQEIVQQVESYRQIIERSQPALQGAVNNKNAREAAINGRLNTFRDGETVAGQLRQFISELEANGAQITAKPHARSPIPGLGSAVWLARPCRLR